MAPSPSSLCSRRRGWAAKPSRAESRETLQVPKEAGRACPTQLRSLGHPHPLSCLPAFAPAATSTQSAPSAPMAPGNVSQDPGAGFPPFCDGSRGHHQKESQLCYIMLSTGRYYNPTPELCRREEEGHGPVRLLFKP